MNIKKTAVIGAGTMGSSIAVALIGSGYQVVLKDINQALLDDGVKRIDKFLASKVKKGLSEPDAQAQRQLVETTTDYRQLQAVDLVIEAVSENIDIKRSVLEELDKHCRPEAILGSNTSSLSITRLGAFTNRPQKVLGLHFFNPAHLMKLVEVIPGLDTSCETMDTACEFVRSLGKLAVRVEECASFLVNRLLGRYMNESLWCLQEGAPVEEIDRAVSNYVMPVGPLALRDMNGADIGLAVAKFNYSEYGDRFLPPPILQAMVDRNILGQKTGQGFYLYDSETKKRDGANPQIAALVGELGGERQPAAVDVERLFMPMINEAFLVLQEKVCAPADLDPALKAGLGMRKGPLELAQDMGLATCLSKMEKLQEHYGERFRPASLLKRYVWGGRRSVVQ
jgi:3-hydroxyacyl-CoA dehydrogenase / enoyl-CoA hydratase / 3-hydroxybutyryl-CoA epimerase